MLNKKIMGLAVVAAMTASGAANAVVDMDDANEAGVKFAIDTLADNATTTVGSATYYNIVDGGTDLSLTSEIGVGVSLNNQAFVRYDLTEAAFATTVLAAHLNATLNGTVAVAQGGAVGDSFVIFSITATADMAQTDPLEFALPSLAVSANGTVGAAASTYETLTAAVNQTGSLNDTSVSTYVSLVSGLTLAVNTDTATADVETEFTKFTTSSSGAITTLIAKTADIDLDAAAGVFDQAGAGVIPGDVISVGNTVLTISGDFSVGTWELNNGATCAGAPTALTLNTAKTEASLTGVADVVNGPLYLCNTVLGDTLIPESTYSYSIAYSHPANIAFPIADASGAFGEIDHNGTTIQIPYITTFSDYNQRLVIVNRGNQDRAYMISFTPEAGVTATAGTAATGTLAAGETTVIKMTDIVTITGGTRTAGTLTVVSPESAIDAATTQVNLSTSGTDTVYLD